MPFVNIKMYKGRSKEEKRRLAQRVTEAVSQTIGVAEDKIWVVIEDISPSSWAVGGKMGDED